MRARVRLPPPRLGWGLADQIASSGTNFGVSFILARSTSLADFGAFSLAFFFYSGVISVCRAFPMEPLAIRYGGADAATWRRGVAAATGTALAIGIVAGVAMVVGGLLAAGVLGAGLVAFGLAMPGLVLQDAWRYAFFAGLRGRQALVNDVVWGVLLALSLLGLLVTGTMSVLTGSLAFGLTASVAAAFGLVQAGVWPRPRQARAWWREQHDLAGRFAVDATARNLAAQGAIYGVGILAGLDGVGTIRAAQLILAPVQVIFYGLTLVAVPEAARALRISRAALVRFSLLSSGALVALAAAWSIAALVLPTDVGVLLLRGNWAPARSVLAPLAVALVGIVATLGPSSGLRALAAAHGVLRAGLAASVGSLLLPIAGAAIGGAMGAAIGFACSGLIGAGLWWSQYFAVVRSPEAVVSTDSRGGGEGSGVPAPEPASDAVVPGGHSPLAP